MAALVLAVAVLITTGGVHMGLLSGSRPSGLGFSGGSFKPCSWKPNCVCSTADPKADAGHFIEPLGFDGDPAAAWQRLAAIVKAAPRVNVVTENSGYLHAEFSSRTMGFVDDVEFALDAAGRRIHARSASRLGVRDFGVNRARVEGIRARFNAAG
ncbi:MAG: DUF1499 domain-containing protein [Burkholderiales bacterium]|nr:DUF1499 domain-containing protein [Burkholderiales bacterium]